VRGGGQAGSRVGSRGLRGCGIGPAHRAGPIFSSVELEPPTLDPRPLRERCLTASSLTRRRRGGKSGTWSLPTPTGVRARAIAGGRPAGQRPAARRQTVPGSASSRSSRRVGSHSSASTTSVASRPYQQAGKPWTPQPSSSSAIRPGRSGGRDDSSNSRLHLPASPECAGTRRRRVGGLPPPGRSWSGRPACGGY
jgi:hypothetical protein